ncbi:DNA cytosine methyltransferase [Actinobacillus porcinus]|uniref:DNA cytosine methyltransferase n=1 Tax=Actinobacillus porcinus TaxID=51048 RepID=UPI002A91DD38|nr:DNA cytosine methyltransferase [Actinobacillus porcinus]MDY6216046.1 DNA cytosine methyltransferase [Actinobacillus porcinus]
MLKTVSLFSGCGGLDLGVTGGFDFMGRNYPKNDYKIVFANDFDNDAINTYKANSKFFDKKHLVSGDIREIDVNSIPDFDVLFAGFPCQPFSNAGNRKGVNDTNGRGTLWEECEKIIQHATKDFKEKPKAFVFENVRGIISSKMPSGKSVPDEIKERMEALGYNVSMQLVKSSDYGVPQNRYRYFIVGVRKDLGVFDFSLLNEIVKEYALPNIENNPYELSLGYVLATIPEDTPQKNDYWKYSPQGQKMVDMIGVCVDGAETLQKFAQKVPFEEISPTITQGKSWKNINPDDLPERFRKIHDDPKRYHAPNFYRRFALGEIAGTITASAQPENCGITHPFENRRFSLREAARIQSFPDDFEFPYKSINGAYKVIGNAVPPVLGWVLARALQRHLEKSDK